MDKCESHDDCFQRLYGKVEGMDDKLDRLFSEIHNRLHEGDLRFIQLEMMAKQIETALVMRVAHIEQQLSEAASVRMTSKEKWLGAGIDIVKTAATAILGAAAWAFANGYRG